MFSNDSIWSNWWGNWSTCVLINLGQRLSVKKAKDLVPNDTRLLRVHVGFAQYVYDFMFESQELVFVLLIKVI